MTDKVYNGDKTKFLETSKAFPQDHMQEQCSRCINKANQSECSRWRTRMCINTALGSAFLFFTTLPTLEFKNVI